MHRLFTIISLATLFGVPASVAGAEEPRIYGWVENGLILPENVQVKAKLDTGAKSSALAARGLERFEHRGEPWVRFKLKARSEESGEKGHLTFERKVVDEVKVQTLGGTETRPVVVMAICVGERRYEERFVLNNKTKAKYALLLGRQTLERMGPVDANKRFTVKPACVAPAIAR